MNTLSELKPDWVSTPGDTIQDLLEEREISIDKFSKSTNLSLSFIDNLLKGNESISKDVANILESFFETSSSFWTKRESQFREQLHNLNKIEEDLWIKSLPIKDMINLGWIKKSKNLVNECLSFFNVSDVKSWHELYEPTLSVTRFRTSERFESKANSVLAWIRQGEIKSGFLKCKKFDVDTLQESLMEIKSLTKVKKLSSFIPRLTDILSNCGVALVITKSPQGCSASGATKFINEDKAMLLMSMRYLSDDQFWFTLFHEIGHLILHRDQKVFIEENGKISTHSKEELEANSFSGEMLIPFELHNDLKNLKGTDKRQVISFANKAGVSPGIVIGQMQHHKLISYSYLNGYKKRYNWDEVSILNI